MGQDLGVRQFLLTNLERAGPADPYKFRLPLKILRDALGEIGQFPYSPEERQWDHPALFIKGESLHLFPASHFLHIDPT